MKYQFEVDKITHCNNCPLRKVWSCPAEVTIQCRVNDKFNDQIYTKPDWCPLIEAPEVDIDRLARLISDYKHGIKRDNHKELEEKAMQDLNKLLNFFE